MKNKAHIFTKEEIGEFVRNDTHSLRSILGVRKALVIIAFFGEHGGHELGYGKKSVLDKKEFMWFMNVPNKDRTNKVPGYIRYN